MVLILEHTISCQFFSAQQPQSGLFVVPKPRSNTLKGVPRLFHGSLPPGTYIRYESALTASTPYYKGELRYKFLHPLRKIK